MEAYTSFALVYDDLMNNIPYQEWTNYVIRLLKQYGVCDGLLLELGCGTGSMTQLLAKQGFDMIGIDNSIEMLEIAQEKAIKDNFDILYLNQDMREFELYGTVNACVSICDSMNYILELDDLAEVFRLANNYLEPSGYFIFDLNTEYKYQTQMADFTIAEDKEDHSFIWENYYDEAEKINEYDLSIFIKEEDDLYRKYQETHYQRAYSLDEVKEAIAKGGMEFVTVYDAFTFDPPKENSERVYVIAKERPTANKLYLNQ